MRKPIFGLLWRNAWSQLLPQNTTLPSLVNGSCGALIDNVYCKLSSRTVTTSSVINLDELSNHYPYFIFVDNLSNTRVKIPRQAKQIINPVNALENILYGMKVADIDKDLLADPK